ncbi:MAG: hypothetical protein ABIZ04_23055 [Opitutus sp.]
MKEIVFVLCVIASAPGYLLGMAGLALEHAIVTRNPFKIFWHFLSAALWVVPITFVLFVSLVIIAFFPEARPYGALVLVALNLAATVVIFLRIGPPDSVAGSFFHVVPIVTAGVSLWLVYDLPVFHPVAIASTSPATQSALPFTR